MYYKDHKTLRMAWAANGDRELLQCIAQGLYGFRVGDVLISHLSKSAKRPHRIMVTGYRAEIQTMLDGSSVFFARPVGVSVKKDHSLSSFEECGSPSFFMERAFVRDE